MSNLRVSLTWQRRWPMLRRWLALVPLLLVVFGLFAGGLLLAVRESFSDSVTGMPLGFTWRHYAALWHDREFFAALGLTLRVALLTTALSALGGTVLALRLHRYTRNARWLTLFLQTSLATPHLVIAGVLLQVIAPSGWLARLAYAAGWLAQPAEFPALLNDRYGIGIVLAYTLKEVPFVALMVLALLARLGDAYENVARTLGANAWQRLRFVTLPLLAPAIWSAALLVFAFVCGAFEIPYLLGRPYPALLSVVAQRRFLDVNLAARPNAMALAIVLFFLTSLCVAAYLRFSRALTTGERTAIL